jgi:hypothetical protein
MEAAKGFDRSAGEAGEGADGAEGDGEESRRGAGRAEAAALGGAESEGFGEGAEAGGAVEKVRGVAGVEEETDFEEETGFRGGAGSGEVVEIGGKEGEDLGVAVAAA